MKTTYTNGLDDACAGCNALKVLYVSVTTFYKFVANKIPNIILDYKDFKVITIFNTICNFNCCFQASRWFSLERRVIDRQRKGEIQMFTDKW